jgi:hypothetical protein
MSIVVDVDGDRCSNCWVCYYKTEWINLQFGCYEQLNCVLCCGWMWVFTALAVECATAKWNESKCYSDARRRLEWSPKFIDLAMVLQNEAYQNIHVKLKDAKFSKLKLEIFLALRLSTFDWSWKKTILYFYNGHRTVSPTDAWFSRVSFASEASGPQKANWNLILVEFRELQK